MADLPSSNNYYSWSHKLERDGVLSKLVMDYYDRCDSIYSVKVNGEERIYPIGTHPQLLHPHFNMNGIELDEDLPEFIEHDEELLKLAGERMANVKGEEYSGDLGDYLWNDPSYAVFSTEIGEPDTPIRFTLGESDFYTSVTQNQKLMTELMEAVMEDHFVGADTIVSSDVLSHYLPTRDRYMDSVVERIRNSSEFKQAIGGTYVTLIRAGDEYYLLSGERSSDLYSWPDSYTIFPAGHMQDTDISSGHIVRDHLLDEYAKEFFGLEDPTLSTRAVKSLNQLLGSEDAQFTITGSGIELLYGDFQITGLLVIEYDDYLEFMQEHSEKSFQHENMSLVPLSELDEIIETFTHPVNITPTSAFSLFNALAYLEDQVPHIENPVDLSIKQRIVDRPPRFEAEPDGSVDLGVDW